jgi:S1-C subfamily serine protease
MLGIQVTDLTPEIARRLGMDAGATGVVVVNVLPGSPASEAGLRPGDILLRVNGQPVNAAADVAGMVRALQAGQDVSVVIQRDRARVLLRARPR